MVTCNDTYQKNFYISTKDIYGEWSAPVFVEQEGIDPSLLFDGDKVYFTSNGCDADGKPCILQCEIDIATGEKLTDSIPVWHGSGGRYLESPHLYHIGGMYYLTAAEGGTEYGHMITYARSENPFGPFEGFSGNPVLTNRNLGGNQSLIQGIGHGDLIEDENGDYYIVCLGFRQSGMWQPYHHLGREVFLAPVSWDDAGWFHAGENGTVAEWMDTGLSAEKPAADCYDVTSLDITNPRWCYLRDYHRENYIYEDDVLKLRGTGFTLEEADTPTFVGVRQSEFETKLCVTVGGNAAEAGFSFYMDESQHYDLALVQNEGKSEVVLKLKVGDAQAVKNTIPVENGEVFLEAESTPDEYSFFVRQGDKRRFVGSARTKYLSSEVAGGFTGVVIGLYAIDEDGRWSEFKDFSLTQRQEN
jgi:alpha-N-arabinofuranosidase